MTKKAKLIYDPASGHKRMLQSVADISNVLEQAGFKANAFRTMLEPLSVQNEVRRCALAGFDLLAGAGRDEMINEVVNGIAPLEERPKLAVIPVGTMNDFAQALKIPGDNLVDAAKVTLTDKAQGMDISRAGKQYFMNIAASGSLTKLTCGVSSGMKSVPGYSAYLLKGTEMLPKVSSNKIRLTYDNNVHEGNLSMFLLEMTNSIGDFERIMPDTQLSDGLFQLVVVKTTNSIDVLRLATTIPNGGHVNDPQIIYTKTKYLKVELLDNNKDKEPIPINLDGEIGNHLPIDFESLKQHIELYIS